MKKLRLLLALLVIPTLALTGCGSDTIDNSSALNECEEKLNTTINELDVCLQSKLINTWTTTTGIAIPSTGIDTNTTSDTINSNMEDTLKTHAMFPPQPQVPAGDYTSNTKQLNDYAHNSMRSIMVPDSYNTIIIEFLKPVASKGRNLILYIEGNGRHCGGRIATNIPVGTTSLTYDLTSIDMQGTSCDGDRRAKLGNTTTIKAGGFISEYNGNQINVIYLN